MLREDLWRLQGFREHHDGYRQKTGAGGPREYAATVDKGWQGGAPCRDPISSSIHSSSGQATTAAVAGKDHGYDPNL